MSLGFPFGFFKTEPDAVSGGNTPPPATPGDPAVLNFLQQFKQGGVAGAANAWKEKTLAENPPAPPPNQTPADLKTFEGVPGQDTAPKDTNATFVRGLQMESELFGQRGLPPQPAIQGEGERYTPGGGAKGKENYQEAFYDDPAKIAEAIMKGAEAQTQESEAKADVLKAERSRQDTANAAIMARYRQDQAAQEARVQAMEKQLQYYTQDLADKGQFWRNPGNIVAAFGAALIGAASGDPTVGVKIINGAINADLHQRKSLADMHMGELRSNLGLYRQMMGDRLQGDLMAEAEAKRMAALELERISAQFAGPKAKANAAAIVGNLMQEAAVARIMVYNRMFYNDARTVPQGYLKEMQKSGKALPGVGWSPLVPEQAPNSSTVPMAPGSPQTGSVPGKVGTPQAGGKTSSVPIYGPQNPDSVYAQMSPRGRKRPGVEAFIAQADRDYPGMGDFFRSALANLEQTAQNHGIPGSPAYETYMNERQKEARKGVAEIAKAHAPFAKRTEGLRIIKSDMAAFEKGLRQFGMDPDEVLRSGLKAFMGSDKYRKIVNMYDATIGTAPEAEKNKWKQAKANVVQAAERLSQLMAGDINAYYHEQSGSATTATELPRLQEYVSQGMGFKGIMNYLDFESRQKEAQFREFLKHSGDPLSALIYLAEMGTHRTQGMSTDAPRPKGE